LPLRSKLSGLQVNEGPRACCFAHSFLFTNINYGKLGNAAMKIMMIMMKVSNNISKFGLEALKISDEF
jgi:hypothetical protein